MLLVPLATGAAVGLFRGGEAARLVPLGIAALGLFWLRTPVESWIGASPLRAQPGGELRLVRRTVFALSALSAVALAALFWDGRNRDLFAIGAAAAAAFLLQVWLKKVSRRARVAAQLVGAAGLTAAAPAAWVVATGHWDAAAALLWAANYLFAGNQIQFVQLRIHGSRAGSRAAQLAAGGGFLAGQLLLVALLVTAGFLGILPWLAALAFVPVLVRGFAWFVRRPGPLVIRALGFAELAQAAAFGILLVWGLTYTFRR